MEALAGGGEFVEAQRLVSSGSGGIALTRKVVSQNRPDLTETIIHPSLTEAQETAIDAFEEMSEQLRKERGRLEELRQIRLKDPGGRLGPCLDLKLSFRYLLYGGSRGRLGGSGRCDRGYHDCDRLYSVYCWGYNYHVAIYQNHWVGTAYTILLFLIVTG